MSSLSKQRQQPKVRSFASRFISPFIQYSYYRPCSTYRPATTTTSTPARSSYNQWPLPISIIIHNPSSPKWHNIHPRAPISRLRPSLKPIRFNPTPITNSRLIQRRPDPNPSRSNTRLQAHHQGCPRPSRRSRTHSCTKSNHPRDREASHGPGH